MKSISNLIFSEQRIATNSSVSNSLGCSIDEANRLMYEFYQRNKEKISSYFVVISRDDSLKVKVDRIPEEALLSLLGDSEYMKDVIEVKVWAFFDKNRGELSLDTVYEDEEPVRHAIANLREKFREIRIRRPTVQSQSQSSSQQNKKPNSTASSQKENKSASTSATTLERAKPISTTNTQEKNKAGLTEITNNPSTSNKKATKIEPEEETAIKPEEAKPKTNQKKRKAEPAESVSKAVGKDKDLKKTKFVKNIEHQEEEKPKILKRQETNDDEEYYYGKENSLPGLIPKATSIIPDIDMNHPAADETSLKMEQLAVSCEAETNRKSVKQTLKQQEEMTVKPLEPVKKSKSFDPVIKSGNEMDIQDEGNEQEPEVIKVKRVRKVLKDKSYMDAKGYLVIEKVEEDEEFWEEVKKPATSTANPVVQQKKKPAEKNQATLSSFFKKK